MFFILFVYDLIRNKYKKTVSSIAVIARAQCVVAKILPSEMCVER